MRPQRLQPYDEAVLLSMFHKVKNDMRGRSNQFQLASKLISYFKTDLFDRNITSLDEEGRRVAYMRSLASYFEMDESNVDGVLWYVRGATPAAIVQMVKRIKFRYKTQNA